MLYIRYVLAQFTNGCFNGLGVFNSNAGTRYEGEWCVCGCDRMTCFADCVAFYLHA